MSVTYQAPVQRGGKVVGSAGTASTLAVIDSRIGKMKFYESGYAFATSAKGMLIASPDKAQTGKVTLAELAQKTGNAELKQVADSIAAGRSGQIETKDPFTGKDVVLTWSKIDAAGWSFLTVRPAVRGARPGQEPQDRAARRRPDRADPHQRRDRVGREPAHQADPHRHRGRRARRRG